MFATITILGPGLLGGSIGMAIRQHKVAESVCIWARRPEAAVQACDRGAADRAEPDLRHAVQDADLVVLATPIGTMADLVTRMKSGLKPGALVTDVGSVKYPVVTALDDLLSGTAQFVGAHPMAGSEQSGIEVARADLFDDAVCLLTPSEVTDRDALAKIHDFWVALGCRVQTVAPHLHDEIVGQVSHLPHLTAAALVNAVCRSDATMLGYAGAGLRDSTRIAAGDPEMWTEICLENQQEIRRALDELIDELGQFRAVLENQDAVGLKALLKRAKHYRDELKFRG